ncbi:PEP-CTERM sorting domain-containing protein [Derxia lacustris]|uniref:PEP-CTERM sorting domain-containing protein n=1 Tax=Derxia lacustris TaxID=764842 RepID=UPI000A16E03E|nr:PEP-CTERM sorting domain-containing protein [Derxia lacustris]
MNRLIPTALLALGLAGAALPAPAAQIEIDFAGTVTGLYPRLPPTLPNEMPSSWIGLGMHGSVSIDLDSPWVDNRSWAYGDELADLGTRPAGARYWLQVSLTNPDGSLVGLPSHPAGNESAYADLADGSGGAEELLIQRFGAATSEPLSQDRFSLYLVGPAGPLLDGTTFRSLRGIDIGGLVYDRQGDVYGRTDDGRRVGYAFHIDSISLTNSAPVPEPAAGLAFGVGLGLLGWRRRAQAVAGAR